MGAMRDALPPLVLGDDGLPSQDLRSFCARLGAVLWVFDLALGRIVYVNEVFEALWGRPASELYAAPASWLREVRREDRRPVLRAIRALRQGRPIQLCCDIRHAGGGVRRLQARAVPIDDAGGKTPRAVGIAQVVSAPCAGEVRLDRSLEERDQRAQLAEAARQSSLNELAAGMAHELSQPLAAIANYARGCTLRIGVGGDPELLRALDAIGAETTRAGGILRRLRGCVRRDARPRRPCSANELVNRALVTLGHLTRATEVRIDLDLEAGDDTVLTDPIEAHQILVHLLRNACEALEESEARNRRIEIGTRRDDDGRQLTVSVRDHGPGLSAKAAERAFDPFFSGGVRRLGLGLTVSRSVAETLGGRLWHAEPQGGGALFCFTLPAASERMHP